MSGSSPKRSSVDIRLGLGGLLQHLRGSGERSFPNCRSLRGETSVSYRALRTFSTTSQYRNRWTCSRPHAGWSVAYELRPFVLYGSQNIWSRWQELEPLSYLHNPPLNLRPRCISLGNLKMKRIVMDLAILSCLTTNYYPLSSFDPNDLSVCHHWLWSANVIPSAWLVEGVQEWINYCGKSKTICFVSTDHPAFYTLWYHYFLICSYSPSGEEKNEIISVAEYLYLMWCCPSAPYRLSSRVF